MSTTLTRPLKGKTEFSKGKLVSLDERTRSAQGEEINIVFIPEHVTPLSVYEVELLKAGYSTEHVQEIIDGLAESPLYESKTTK